ncbi:MAG: hypothetical protein HC893_09710 [Chloroflexaceae bacterium]|nr:hypothetical protein [Chloroflexaceae bacterium]NJL34077.1 hypothetical protein [Chloroflexaceae bacterium]NJO04338.1 hypothetical protein [Chloroflexaceae bacterium]
MAVNMPQQRLFPLRQARARRRALMHYLKLDSSRYLLGVVVLLCLMSMIALGQTGVVATKGYAIVELETQKVELQRERTHLHMRHAEAQSLERVRHRAEEIGLRPVAAGQARHMAVNALPSAADQMQAAALESATEPQN